MYLPLHHETHCILPSRFEIVFQVARGSSTYYMNVCGSVTDFEAVNAGCGQAAVCQLDNQGKAFKFGLPSQETFRMEGKSLKVGYTGGDACTGQSMLFFFKF